MKKILYALLVAVSGLFSACDNEDSAPFAPISDICSRSSDVTEYLNITYKDTTYLDVPTTYDENGDFIFMDEEFAAIYAAELANDPDWSISATDAANITFYNNLEDNLNDNGIEIPDSCSIIPLDSYNMAMGTRAGGGDTDLASVLLYDDKEFKDRSVGFVLTRLTSRYENSKFGSYPWSFNDKCSSMKISNQMPKDPTSILVNENLKYSEAYLVFIGYDDHDYSDRSIICVVPHQTLKEYSSLPGFNDKMSSCKCFYAKIGDYQSNI